MAKAKKVTPEEQRENDLVRARDRKYIPEPTYFFEIGDKVSMGNLQDVIVVDVLDGGKIYELEVTYTKTNYGNPIVIKGETRFVNWLEVRPVYKTKNSFIENDDVFINYAQMDIASIYGKMYYFGINMNPEYQRGYVWSIEDQRNLIDSIFKNIDIGKFIFVELPIESSGKVYEILDGKQRVKAICDFYENRFSYNGLFFNDLSKRDQYHIKFYGISVAKISRVTDEQKIKIFLMVNENGKVMSQEHLEKIRGMIE